MKILRLFLISFILCFTTVDRVKKTILCFVFVLLPYFCWAADRYVDVDSIGGVCGDSGSGTISSPWCSVSYAWANATNDDVVYYRTGTYTISSEIDVNGGGENITHQNYDGESVTWTSSVAGDVININEPNTVIDGIDIAWTGGNTNLGDDGFFRLNWSSNTNDTSGFILKNSTLTSNNYSSGGGNLGFVHAGTNSGSYGPVTIENCDFEGAGAGLGTWNTTSIVMFKVTDWTVTNCEFHDLYTGIFYNKHPDALATSDGEISNCYFYNCTIAVTVQGNNVDIKNNIINGNVNIGYDGGCSNEDGNCGSDFLLWDHNTIYNSNGLENFKSAGQTRGGDNYPGAYQNNYTNNVFLTYRTYDNYTHASLGDYNLHVAGDIAYKFGVSTYYNLSEWQTELGGCPGSNNECNSIQGAPTFVGGASPSTIAGFALTPESIGYQACADGSDMGANVATVGVGGGSTPSVSGITFSGVTIGQ
jgi:hypothetical protein